MQATRATVYSKLQCPFCDKAKALLTSKGYEILEHKIGVNFTKEEFFDKFPGVRTVPQIVIEGRHVGGWTELEAELTK
jgi:glutaredoxin 3